MTEHSIQPVYDAQSRILILGSFPSVQSRQSGFFYGNPSNRFWKIMSALYHESPLQNTEEKIAFLLRHRIALYDVVLRCDIQGSSDSSIQNIVPSDLNVIIQYSQIKHVFTNGKLAHKLYQKYQQAQTKIEAVNLPSTSSANASYALDRLLVHWKQISDIPF